MLSRKLYFERMGIDLLGAEFKVEVVLNPTAGAMGALATSERMFHGFLFDHRFCVRSEIMVYCCRLPDSPVP
jgi:hypothetical protein